MSGLAQAILSFTGIAGLRSGWVNKLGHSFYCWLVCPCLTENLGLFPLCRFGIARRNLAKKKEGCAPKKTFLKGDLPSA